MKEYEYKTGYISTMVSQHTTEKLLIDMLEENCDWEFMGFVPFEKTSHLTLLFRKEITS
jgi:hypothetical protein